MNIKKKDNKKISKPKAMFFLLLPVIAMIIGLVCFLLVLNLDFVSNKDNAVALLRGYYNRYLCFIVFFVVFLLLMLVSSIFSFKFRILNKKFIDEMFSRINDRKFMLLIKRMAYIPFIVCIIFAFAFIKIENVFDKMSMLKQDIAQIKNNVLTENVIMFNGNSDVDSINVTKIYTDDPTVRYSGIIKDREQGGWIDFYFPNYLEFNLPDDAVYNQYKSIQWNNENVKSYKIQYTDNFKLVTSFELMGS